MRLPHCPDKLFLCEIVCERPRADPWASGIHRIRACAERCPEGLIRARRGKDLDRPFLSAVPCCTYPVPFCHICADPFRQNISVMKWAVYPDSPLSSFSCCFFTAASPAVTFSGFSSRFPVLRSASGDHCSPLSSLQALSPRFPV